MEGPYKLSEDEEMIMTAVRDMAKDKIAPRAVADGVAPVEIRDNKEPPGWDPQREPRVQPEPRLHLGADG